MTLGTCGFSKGFETRRIVGVANFSFQTPSGAPCARGCWIKKQGGHNRPSLCQQDVVGSAGGGCVHALDADALRHQGAQQGGGGKPHPGPTSEENQFGAGCGQQGEVGLGERLKMADVPGLNPLRPGYDHALSEGASVDHHAFAGVSGNGIGALDSVGLKLHGIAPFQNDLFMDAEPSCSVELGRRRTEENALA
jgi:hypothetical protein